MSLSAARPRQLHTAEMMRVGFLLLFVLTDGVFCRVCSYQDVLDHLNLTKDNDVYKLTRPVLDHTHTTVVKLDILVYALLAVIEKTQKFVPLIWTSMHWKNERIFWDPAQFCGIAQISVPEYMLWKPDLVIYEMVQKDDSHHNMYLLVSHDGTVHFGEDMRVVSTCKMDVHKFPFDTQECTMTISSVIHSVKELQILPVSNSSRATQFSHEMMKTQGEWEFLQLSVGSSNLTFDNESWEILTYTVTIKRRPLLHVINFLLPVLFFLILDLASFFISNHRGEKLSFKVTVLLAISVLLLILNDILPSMSNKTPLIASYCIVIFALMLLSLLETILVTYLIEKDSKEELDLQDKEEGKLERETADKNQSVCSSICRVSLQLKLLPVSEEEQENNSVQSGEARVLLLILDELKKLQKTVLLHLSCKEKKIKSAHWANRINQVFFIVYIITVFAFLSFLFREWNS